MRLLVEVTIDVDNEKIALYEAQSMSPEDARYQAAQDEIGPVGGQVVKLLELPKVFRR